jgi:hypothetical protein
VKKRATILLQSLFLISSMIFLSACTHQSLQTQHYYTGYSKNDILYAAKVAFNMDSNNRYIIDSYRDKIEVTKIEPLLHTLQHKDFVLKVHEDACGTTAQLQIEASVGMHKILKHDVFAHEHQEFWQRIAFLLNQKNSIEINTLHYTRQIDQNTIVAKNHPQLLYEKRVIPTKNLQNCVIRSEFEKGAVRHNLKQGEQTYEMF